MYGKYWQSICKFPRLQHLTHPNNKQRFYKCCENGDLLVGSIKTVVYIKGTKKYIKW